MADTKPTTQKFSKGERSIPHHSQKASKYYPAEDVAVPKKVRSADAIARKDQEEEDTHGRIAATRNVRLQSERPDDLNAARCIK